MNEKQITCETHRNATNGPVGWVESGHGPWELLVDEAAATIDHWGESFPGDVLVRLDLAYAKHDGFPGKGEKTIAGQVAKCARAIASLGKQRAGKPSWGALTGVTLTVHVPRVNSGQPSLYAHYRWRLPERK